MYGRKLRPVTDEDREGVRRLAAQGLGRNAIARELKRSPRTISVIAAQLDPPVLFDRTMTAVATEARIMDGKARRAAIVERLYARTERLLDQLEGAEEGVFKFTTGTGQGIETETLDHVPGQEEKALAGAITQYTNQAVKLEALDAGSGHDEDRGILAGIAKALGWQTPGGSGDD